MQKYPQIPDTALRVFRRHLQLQPGAAEEYISYLLKLNRVDAAAVQLAALVDNDSFRSKHGKAPHDVGGPGSVWYPLFFSPCNLLTPLNPFT